MMLLEVHSLEAAPRNKGVPCGHCTEKELVSYLADTAHTFLLTKRPTQALATGGVTNAPRYCPQGVALTHLAPLKTAHCQTEPVRLTLVAVVTRSSSVTTALLGHGPVDLSCDREPSTVFSQFQGKRRKESFCGRLKLPPTH